MGNNKGALAVFAALALVVPPREATACLFPPPVPTLDGIPAQDSVGVPTDIVPVFDYFKADIADPELHLVPLFFTLTSQGGETIAVTPRRRHVNHFELVPASALKPRTLYQLRGRWLGLLSAKQADITIRFTTGDGPVAAAPQPPAAAMQHYKFDVFDGSECGVPRAAACVSYPADTVVEFTYVDSLGQEPTRSELVGPNLYRTPPWSVFSGGGADPQYQCVKLRTRADNGTYSAPVILCAKDAPVYELRGSANVECTSRGLVHDGRLVSAANTDAAAEVKIDGGATDAQSPSGGMDSAVTGAPDASPSGGPDPSLPPGGAPPGSKPTYKGGCSLAATPPPAGIILLVLAALPAVRRMRRR